MAAERSDDQAGAAAVTDRRLPRLPPVGFWSYARQDDELSFGKLSTLRSLLIHELQQLYGREQIRLFQDASTIAHGSDWEREIQKAIDASVFFIPIITPNFVQSEWCAREVELFLDRERTLLTLHPGLSERSRIFPILFIDIEDVDPEKPEILAALQKLQWFDFRRYRHKSYEEAAVREALSELAGTIRSLLRAKTASGTAEPGSPPARQEAEPPPAPEAAAERPPAAGQPGRPIETGDLLNHMFEVKRFIKAGGMGQVFEGSNVMTGERVAIKALLPALAADPKITGLFQREALTLTRLNHEALVQYRALAKEPVLGSLYIVTEYVDGVDLGDALGTVERTSPVLKRLLGRLAAGLAAAHRLGAIHRDISPDNVMLPGGDIHEAKIIDFGIAKDLGGSLPTLIGQGFAGKLNYVAPEQLGDHDGEIGPWTDVYSLALVILAVARGEKVDMSGSFADAIRKRRDGPDLAAAPEDLRPLLADMLRTDPAARIRSMEEVIARLGALDRPAAPPPLAEAKTAPPAPAPVAAAPPSAEEPETVVVDGPLPQYEAPEEPAVHYGGYAGESVHPLRSLRRKLLLILIGVGIVAILGLFLLSRTSEPEEPPPPSESNIVTLPSGVRYQTVQDGTGPTMTTADRITLRYRLHANSLDAPVIDEAGYSNGARTMRTAEVWPGFAEALQAMREGGRYVVWLPPGTIGQVPADAPFTPRDTLVFEVEVVRIGRGQAPGAPPAVAPSPAPPVSSAPTPSTVGSTPPPPSGRATPAVVIGNPASYFSDNDYPVAAIRQRAEGTTGFSLTIGPNGRVAGCRITSSSGSAALDAATCRVMSARARYVPARDGAGRPVVGTDSGRVAWQLPAMGR
jgi:TonB family protein